MNNLQGYDETVECPYNRAHQILKSRIQFHLVKCRKSYPDEQKETCPFNATHIMNAKEKDLHVGSCPDRASYERYRCNVASDNAPKNSSEQEPAPRPHISTTITDGENWDDCDVPSYNPQEYVQNNPVLRTLNLAPPSQRKAFREAERRRLNDMDN